MGTLTYSHEGVTLDVEFDRYDLATNRGKWKYIITLDATPEPIVHSAADIETPRYDMVGALRSLVSFLDAWAEASPDGENGSLFPSELRDVLDWTSWCSHAVSDMEVWT